MNLGRRLLTAGSLALWQGGFVFYALVVVPVGAGVLGSDLDQGFITRRVTVYLNLIGAAALPILLWDTAAVRPLRRSRLAGWVGLAATLAVLAVLHPRLDALLDADDFTLVNRPRFYRLHRGYLLVSTVQVLVALTFAALSLAAWNREDRPSIAQR